MTETFTLIIGIGNAATVNATGHATVLALAAMLRDAATRVERGERDGRIRDANGNRVGYWAITAK